MPVITPGSKLSHFEVLEKLGEGGMGIVYKARDLRLDRLVAIKVLPEKAVSNAEREARFIQEAKAASALNHANIITVHEIDSAGDVTFIAMEYVDGRTLHQVIPRKGLRFTEALKYAVQITDAFAAAHGIGIIHRDLKPANIMVTGKGLVKVLDFGLAKLTANSDRTRVRRNGQHGPTNIGTRLDSGNRRVYVARAGRRQANRCPLRHLLLRHRAV